MSTNPFLTDLDTRAQVKGSVDPLGAMSIWSAMGRRVVGNLTTVSDTVKDFKTLVIGFALIEDLRQRAGPEADTDELGIFLRWEQLAAYIRLKFNNDKSFRGTTRVQRQLSEGATVPLSKERDAQILGNQKVYGLWGLFTVPARVSGLIEKDTNALTDAAREFLRSSWRRQFAQIWPSLLNLVSRDNRRVNLDRLDSDLRRLGGIWRRTESSERDFWTRHLVKGGPADKTAGRQSILAELLRDTLVDEDFGLTQQTVRQLAAKARRRDEKLSIDLLNVAACESVLAPATSLFAFLQSRDGQSLDSVVTSVSRSWPLSIESVDLKRFEFLQPDLALTTVSSAIVNHWIAIARALSGGQYREAILRVLDVNKLVMASRGGAAWVAEVDGMLRVKFRDDAGVLPERSKIKNLWRNPYFIVSLRSVVGQLEAA